MKKAFLIFVLIFLTAVLWAETGITTSHELSINATTNIDVMLGFTTRFRFPFMQGGSPLTEGNNLTLALGADLTPINFIGRTELIFTPIAFLELNAGGNIGSGWNINLFDEDIYGIGFNWPLVDGGREHRGEAFDGIHWKGFIGGALQADLAAFFPGAWNHVIFRTYHEMSYRAYSRADAFTESWYYLSDAGENRNSFYYYGNFILGYQMPIFLSMVALVAEGERDLYLDGTPTPATWGHDKIYWTFSSIFNFTITRQIDIGIAVQFHTQRNYLQSNWDDLFYTGRILDSDKPVRLEFRRVAVVFTYRF
ncbi:MAG: hypothetical protein FWG77_07590 [Treponema sp.]|nr:hypothetical protein [Treponema sp.]